ncbi:restriction endonuclease subunit S [Helicobacter bizzozeronii]|uniref:restriction endonuclease subunit S n=1 Tax=Helicobacter bizzozeronii TaxID=56877 RepID=UPI0013151EC8
MHRGQERGNSHLNYLKRSILSNNDVILTIKGKIGNAVPIFNLKESLNINQDVAKISCQNTINIFYLSAFLNCQYGKKQMAYKATGQINPFLSLSSLRTLKIPLLPLDFQDTSSRFTQPTP